jgi:hypothetical protein
LRDFAAIAKATPSCRVDGAGARLFGVCQAILALVAGARQITT